MSLWINAVQLYRQDRVDHMIILDFSTVHIERATQIAKQNYEAESGFVDALPPVEQWLGLKPFAENGLGVAAFDGDDIVGFLCDHCGRLGKRV